MKYTMVLRLLYSITLGVLLTLLCCGCSKKAVEEKYEDVSRPHDPWVFRSVMDAQPRMLTIALDDDLWLSYSTETAQLRQAWRGNVNFDGAVYTTIHGPQPSSLGDFWLLREGETTTDWTIPDKSGTLEVNWLGHRLYGTAKVTLNYELLLPDGRRIEVQETPTIKRTEDSLVILERTFELSEAVPLSLSIPVQSIALSSSLQSTADIELEGKDPQKFDGLTALNETGELRITEPSTTLSMVFVKKPLIRNPNRIVGAEEEEIRPPGYNLIGKSDCKTCHNTHVNTIGPSYAAIAERYRNTPENIDMLISKVSQGGGGTWGNAMMTPHPNLPESDIRSMVEYIMSLDKEEEARLAAETPLVNNEELTYLVGAEGVNPKKLSMGALARVFTLDYAPSELADFNWKAKPDYVGGIPVLAADNVDFGGLDQNFGVLATGYLRIPKTSNYLFRLSSDDGSRLLIDNREIINNDGLHGPEDVDGEIALEEGLHPFRMEFFQRGGGKMYRLQWRSFDDPKWKSIGAGDMLHSREDIPLGSVAPPLAGGDAIPGDQFPVAGVHPAYTLTQARPNVFSPKVGGMDFMADGRLVVSTWDAEGAVYILDGVQSGDPEQMSYKKVASGLAEPLGLKEVDDTIYVLQKQELTKLIDHNGDGVIDEYYALANDWAVSDNFHEFAFGLVYKDGWFYGNLAIAILPGGASKQPQEEDRGKTFRVRRSDGKLEFYAEGFRTPNGIGLGIDDEIFVADNQGDWLPSSKILHVTEGDFFGSRAVDPIRAAQLDEKPPVVWLPQDEIGNSPSTPILLPDGPYAGQMMHGEVTHGGIKRVFVEKINGQYQGAVFRFIQGLEAGVNRLVYGPDDAIYMGGIGSTGNWQQNGKLWYGLQRLKYNGNPVFEMLAVRAKKDGIEIEFTEPLPTGVGWDAEEYEVRQWYYQPTENYGGPKLDERRLHIAQASVSNDRRKVALQLPDIKTGHVIYIRLPYYWTSEAGREMWSTEAWYTLNQVPAESNVFIAAAPAPQPHNTLSETERRDGWQLLFDGESTQGWHNYNQSTVGSSWKIDDHALYLDARPSADGGWQAEDGGDILCEESYGNFELKVDWKIGPCGNSGIMYHVVEQDSIPYPWMTGPEMQVLDNTCHPDSRFKTHRAGSLYDMLTVDYETVRPAGSWNNAKIVVRDGQLEHWLNGRKVVSTTMWDDNWWSMVNNSKWKDYPLFSRNKEGKISLQDHGDPVWFRNIKVRRLD